MPEVASTIAIITATYAAINNVKLYRRQCEDLRGRCLNLLNAIDDGGKGLDGTSIMGILDELSVVVERIQAKITEWATWSRLKCVVQQGDMKDGIDRLNRELDACMMKFNIQANIGIHKNHVDLRSIQDRDNSNIRELLWTIVKSQDDMRLLLNSQSAPVVEEVMENLQTQLMTSALQPGEEQDFKAGLWQLHEQTSKLPPLTDLSGQITLLPSKPISGSSNDIYQGQWLDKQKVALRCPRALDDSPATRKRFEREVSSWRQLHHPNVVPLYGVVNIDGKLFSVTPWMDNGNAATYVARFTSVDRMKLLYETACGLEYLHEMKIVHGDIRANNVLVSQDAVACLSDFGLSKFFEDCDRNLIPSNNASIRWTAPEVLRYDGSVSNHSDVWSFGMVCLEILSGRVPFHGKDDRVVGRQLDHGKHPDRPDYISDEMWDLLLKCWSKNPEVRPHMSVVRGTLKEIRSNHLDDRQSISSVSSRKPKLRMIANLFGRKIDDEKEQTLVGGKNSPTKSISATSLRVQESLGQKSGHDWKVMERGSSTHSYGVPSSVTNSSPPTGHREPLTRSPNQPGFGRHSNDLRVEMGSTYLPSSSRPSTGNSHSSRHWPPSNMYDIPDDDEDADERNIPVQWGDRHTSHGTPHSMSGQSHSTAGTSRPSTRSSLVDITPISRGYPSIPTRSSELPTSTSAQISSTRETSGPSTMSPLTEIRPSISTSSNVSATDLTPLGMDFLSSSPPRISRLGDTPSIQTSHQRSPTGSSDLNHQHVVGIQNATESRQSILHSRSGLVSSGTLEGLVQFLIDGFDSPRHTEYRDVFLMACAEFTTPDGLFQILSRRFVDEERNPVTESRVITQYNILMIISYWLQGSYLTPNQELLYRMKFFCEEIAQLKPPGTLHERAKALHHIVADEIDKLRSIPPSALETRLGGITLQSPQVTPHDLAIGLTLLEGDNYSALHASDYIMHLSKRQSTKIKTLYDVNNKIKVWVTESILHFNDVHDRAEVLKFFIHTAVECLTMRNFSSSTAIASALHSTAVDNLGVTRKALTRSMQSKLSDLYDIINPMSNHRGYRDALHALGKDDQIDTCVPWMAFHLKELNKVLRAYPVTIEADGQYLINFNRYVKFMDRTMEIMYYVPPCLEEFRQQGQLAYLLNQLRSISPSDDTDDRLMARSKELMSQEASDYRTRKPQLVKLGFDF